MGRLKVGANQRDLHVDAAAVTGAVKSSACWESRPPHDSAIESDDDADSLSIAFTIWALATTVWTLVFFAVVFGLFYGGFVALVPALVMDYFDGRNISGIIGILYTSVAVGTLIGPSLAGYVFDVRHSYALAIAVSACTNVVAAAIVALSSREPVRSAVGAPARTSIRPQDRVARRVRRRELAR